MQKIVISGGTGFIGRAVVTALVARGDCVTVLTRDPAARPSSTVERERWDPMRDEVPASVSGADAVVNLAGEPAVGARWSDKVKAAIADSRLKATRGIVQAIERAEKRPRVLVSASAVGYYGAHGDEPLDENAPAGSDFLATVTVRWEGEAARAEALGVRVVRARFGIVLGRGGGALAEMVRPFKLFVGGPIASGRQVVSWVHLDDVVGVLLRAIDDPTLQGPINVTAPNPVSNEELSSAIGHVLHRPSLMRVPEAALRLRFADGAGPLVTGQRALPRVLEHAGYAFRYTRAEDAIRDALG